LEFFILKNICLNKHNKKAKLREINNKLNILSGTLIIPKIIQREKIIHIEKKEKTTFNNNNNININSATNNSKENMHIGKAPPNANYNSTNQSSDVINDHYDDLNNKIHNHHNQEIYIRVKNETSNNKSNTSSGNSNITLLKEELTTDFFSENSISLGIVDSYLFLYNFFLSFFEF